ncbi:MAG: hypothetical protein AB8G15_12695, partial [Saprospiraceae bacterium]
MNDLKKIYKKLGESQWGKKLLSLLSLCLFLQLGIAQNSVLLNEILLEPLNETTNLELIDLEEGPGLVFRNEGPSEMAYGIFANVPATPQIELSFENLAISGMGAWTLDLNTQGDVTPG